MSRNTILGIAVAIIAIVTTVGQSLVAKFGEVNDGLNQ